MFTPGAHIKVVESSVIHGTGPRKGSLGYFVDSPSTIPLSINGFNCVGYTTTIIFHKYGNETRARKEQKQVMLLFPADTVTGDAATPFLKLKQRITSAKFEDWRASVREGAGGNKSLPLIVAVPVGATICLNSCPELEFSAWVESILRGPTFNRINRMFLTMHFKSNEFLASNTQALARLRDMAVNKDHRDAVISAAIKGTLDISRKEFVRVIQTVLALSASAKAKDAFLSRRIFIESGEYYTGHPEELCIASVLCQGLFNPQLFNHTKHACEAMIPSGKFKPVWKNVNILKETALGLS